MSTYQTDTSTWQMRTVQFIFIAFALVVIVTSGYEYVEGTESNLLSSFIGLFLLIKGISFPKMFTLNTITIDEQAIRNYSPATRFDPAMEEKSNWTNIDKIILGRFSVRVTENMPLTNRGMQLVRKYKLPVYTRNQYQEIKSKIQHLADENNVRFETKSW